MMANTKTELRDRIWYAVSDSLEARLEDDIHLDLNVGRDTKRFRKMVSDVTDAVLSAAEAEMNVSDGLREQLRVAERYRGIYQSRANERAEELNVLGDVNASLKEQLTQKVPEEFHGLWRRIANQRRSLRVLHRWNEMLNRWGDEQALELRKLRLAMAASDTPEKG